MRNIVDAVQIRVPPLVVHVLPLRPHDLQRVLAEEQLARLPENSEPQTSREFPKTAETPHPMYFWRRATVSLLQICSAISERRDRLALSEARLFLNGVVAGCARSFDLKTGMRGAVI